MAVPILFLLATLAAALFGASFAPGTWYETLVKPEWTPPSSVFGPVWTVLYVSIAVAGWRAWRARPGGRRAAVSLWLVQLGLNAAWSWLFFGLHRPGLAFVEIASLWLAILATAAVFLRRDRIAGMLMLPYLGWVSFAAALNFAIWRLNA